MPAKTIHRTTVGAAHRTDPVKMMGRGAQVCTHHTRWFWQRFGAHAVRDAHRFSLVRLNTSAPCVTALLGHELYRFRAELIAL